MRSPTPIEPGSPHTIALPGMLNAEVLERIAARRAELDGLEEQLVKQLDQVRADLRIHARRT